MAGKILSRYLIVKIFQMPKSYLLKADKQVPQFDIEKTCELIARKYYWLML